ncbi:MAG TPA: hypothetical protein VH187_13565 [Scandinavium sp.]|jgi:hypothetical protein|uniref:hypothetical protein n=1 Tax=Scandinavium sp. TaxID=2830653 RepID=UPI002E34BDF1|nr:hypothetical protein [Scandinavium sp.]HEX4502159.1 hypothetical protein [Scandinavium sp.]
MLSATTQGLRDLGQFKKRVAHDYGKSLITLDDFAYISERVQQIEDKLVEIIASNPRRVRDDERIAS